VAAVLLLTPAVCGAQVKTETNCSDRKDNDGDGLADCGDADCAGKPECKPDGSAENTEAKCSDWIDNDEDGYVDCDDHDCERAKVAHCAGSWKGSPNRNVRSGPWDKAGNKPSEEELTHLCEGQSVEDLIGKGDAKDGERNDILCSDGVDNDGDGRIDCADFGCRFDPGVRVCEGSPGMRFSIVAAVGAGYTFVRDTTADPIENEPFVEFSKLQLRSFGPIPYVQDSFYLLSMRAEKTPRLTFAMFQVPLTRGHFLNINSGSGGLSKALVLSAAKQLLLSPPFYLYSAFEQGNSAAAEFSGPIDKKGFARYRAYVAGGAGRSTGNVGGRFFGFDSTNFTWGVGGIVQLNILGRYSGWDSQFLFTASPPTLAVNLGVKYDERSQERYVAMNSSVNFRWGRVAVAAENYTKREFEFESWSTAYNARVGVLLIRKWLMLGADFGEFIAGEPEKAPVVQETDLRRQLNELTWRAALHLYWYRNVGVASLMYTDREVEPSKAGQEGADRERSLRFSVQYRF